MNKRQFYIKVLSLLVISGIAKAGIQAVASTTSAASTVVNNNHHTHNYPEDAVSGSAEVQPTS